MAIHPDGDIIATGQMAAKDVAAWNKGNSKGGKLVNIMIWKALKKCFTKLKKWLTKQMVQS